MSAEENPSAELKVVVDSNNSPDQESNEQVANEEEKQQQIAKDTTTSTTDISSSSPKDRIEAAMRKSKLKKVHKTIHETGGLEEYKYFSFGINDFTEMGIGIFLYFKFLRQLTVLFLLLFLLSTPLLLSCLSSGKLEKTSIQFEQTTIGNLGAADQYDSISYPSSLDLSSVDGIPYLNNYDSDSNTLPKKDAGIIFGAADLIGTIAFLCFLIYISLSQDKAAKAAADAAVTVADYSICVEGLPAICYNREEIQHHFQTKNNYGRVVDVAICCNDTGIIKKYLQKSKVHYRYLAAMKKDDRNASKIESLQKKVEKKKEKIADIKREHDKRCICAYVTFDDAHSVPRVLYDYPGTFLSRLCMSKKLRFRNKYKIKVSPAMEPSNLEYDNFKYSKCNKFLRRAFTLLASFVVIALSCGMSLGAAAFRTSRNLQGEATDECPEIIENALDELKAGNSVYDNDCLCSKLSIDVMYEMSEQCGEYATNLLISNVMAGSSAVLIILVNFGLKFISRVLVKFEKHTNKTTMERELTWKLFVGMFFNTALVILFVNSEWKGPNLFVLGNGEYDDFVPSWYEVVGVSLLLTMVINIVNPHLIPIVAYPFKKCAVSFRLKKLKDNADQLTQKEIEQAVIDGVEFTLAEKYAIICNTIYVAFFYSSGMPILLLIAAITFVVTYLCDKFVLLRYANQPAKYNEDIAQFALVLIKPVIYIHLAVSIWVYGQTTVLTHYPIFPNAPKGRFQRVVLNRNAFPSFVALICLIAFDVALNILKTLKLTDCALFVVRGIAKLFCGCCCPKWFRSANVVDVQEGIKTYLEEVDNGLRFESYLTSLQGDYEDAFFQAELASETKGLLIKEQPLYVKQKMRSKYSSDAPML